MSDYYGDRVWQEPGDQLYIINSAYRNQLFSIKDDHPDGCACSPDFCKNVYDDHDDPCPIEGEHDHWSGSHDSMLWVAEKVPMPCYICGSNHGAECPERDHQGVYLNRVNFAGSRHYYEIEPAVPAPAQPPRGHREGAA